MYKVFILWSDNNEVVDQYGVERCLNILNSNEFIKASKINLNNLNQLNKCNVLIIAGGEPYQIRMRMGGKGAQNIRKFISNGGGYIGICAGSVLAAPKSPTLDLLQHVKMVNDNVWWRSGLCGDIKLKKYTESDKLDTYNFNNSTNGESVKLFSYKNGPLFNIKKSKINKNVFPIASFDGPLYNSGENISHEMLDQINDSYAILHGKFNNGRVLISSIHPEYSDDLNDNLLCEMVFAVI